MDLVFQTLFKYRPYLFEKGRIAFDTSLTPWIIPLLALAGAAAAYVWYRRRLVRSGGGPHPALPSRSFWLLLSFRTVALAALLLMLFRPMLVVSTLLPRENIVAVLVDDSTSMTVQDVGNQSRLEAVKALLDPAQSSFVNALEQRFQTRFFSFSRESQPLDSPASLTAQGKATSLEEALQGALREFASAPLVSVVVLSDGADNASADLASVLNEYRARKVSIAATGIGEPRLKRDIEVVQATSPGSVLPDSVSQAVVSLKSTGYAGQDVVLEVRESGKLVTSKRVKLEGTAEPQMVELDVMPKGSGLKSYVVSVNPQPGEQITANNQQTFLLNVEDSQPKILYLEGSPRWEFKFIRQALEKDKNLQLVTLLRTSANKFYRQGIESEDNLASGYPTSREELFEYKGLMLGSIEASFFSDEQLKMISDFVSLRGGGLIMLGGRSSFDAGGYDRTPIGELLPVVLGERRREESYLRQPLKAELTSYGRNHPATRLVPGEAENERRWEALPEIGDFNWIATSKPGATVLARGKGRGSPVLLAAHRYGRGRVLAFTGDSSWRWRMEMPYTDDSHEVFWRQALRWLVSSTPDQVSLQLSRSVYEQDDTVRFSAEVNDLSFDGVNDADVVASITAPSGKVTELPIRWSGRKDGNYFGAYRATELGSHQIRVAATRGGKEIGQARQYIVVTDSNQEFYGAGLNRDLLSHLATQTGGKYYSLSEAKRLPEELVYQERPNSLPQYLPLWDMPILFLLISSALLGEWLLRRKRGLA
jgi:hypothetical protein